LFVVDEIKNLLHTFAEEPRQFERKQSGGHKFAFFDGVYGEPRDSDRIGERLLGNFVLIEAAASEVIAEFQGLSSFSVAA
jgi:hypothetical protein